MPEEKTTYYSSRPVVSVDGTEERQVGEELLALLVEETLEGLARCEIRIGNWGLKDGETTFLFDDRSTLDFGAEIAVELGPPGRSGEVFRGRVTGLEGEYPVGRPPELVVLAEDRLQDLRMTRRSRSFESVSDADAVRRIASGHGLQPRVDHDGPTYEVLTQVNQSDLAFLRDRARAADALLWIEEDALHFVARSRADRGSVRMTYGRDLRSLMIRADLAHQRTQVRVGGWDVAAKEAVTGEADEGALGSELSGLEGGASILEGTFGARKEHLAHLVPFSRTEATALAEAHSREIGRRFVTGTAETEGDGRIRVGWDLELDGLGELFDGTYFVSEVRHSFDDRRGYRTTARVQRPGIGG